MKTNHTIRIVTNKIGQKKVDRLVNVIQIVLKGMGIVATIFVDETEEVQGGDRQKVQKAG